MVRPACRNVGSIVNQTLHPSLTPTAQGPRTTSAGAGFADAIDIRLVHRMVYKAVDFQENPSVMQLQISLERLSQAISAALALAGLWLGAALAVALLSCSVAQAQSVAKPAAEAAPQAVPGFWDPRRRPD